MFYRVNTCDETCCFFNTTLKKKTLRWKTKDSHQLKKVYMSHPKFKIKLVCFFHHKEIVYNTFSSYGQTVDQHFYLAALKELQEFVLRKRAKS